MQSVVISALLAEALPSGGELWWYCRGIDAAGSGRVSINFAAVAAELKVAYGTVCRWFNRCSDSEENGDRYLFQVLQRKLTNTLCSQGDKCLKSLLFAINAIKHDSQG